jgi:hypothetical protein
MNRHRLIGTFALLIIAAMVTLSECQSYHIHAETQADRAEALINELSICAAFFTISIGRFSQDSNPDVREGALAASEGLDWATGMSRLLARDILHNDAIAYARFAAAIKYMQQEVGDDYANFNAVTDKYLPGCIALMRDPLQTLNSRI